MICRFSFGDRVLNLPAAVTESLADADRLSLCALLLAAKGELQTAEELAAALRAQGVPCNEAQAKGALLFWEQKGILCLSTDNATPDTTAREAAAKKRVRVSDLPQYDGQEMAQKLTENESRIAFLLEDCQQLLHKTFSPAEISRLIALVDFLGMEPDYVRLIFTYCAEREKRAFGYAEKTARNLFAEGIESVAALQIYIDLKKRQKTLEAVVRTIGGLGERALTKKEESLLLAWTRADHSPELVRLAYDITVTNTGKVSLPYMNTILTDWHEQGLRTVEAVQASREQRRESEQSFDTDEFFERALKRSYESLRETEESK